MRHAYLLHLSFTYNSMHRKPKCLYIIDNTLGVDRDNCFSAKFSIAHKDLTAIKSHRKNKKEARRAELDRSVKVSRNTQRGGRRRAKVSIEYSEYQITGCNSNYKYISHALGHKVRYGDIYAITLQQI